MLISLYNVNESKYHINKIPLLVKNVNCNMLEPFDIESPTVSINNTTEAFNYVSIQFNDRVRFYYINKRTIEKHNIILSLTEDYLATFRTEILNSYAHISRSNKGNRYIKDNLCVQTNKTVYQARKIGKLANSGDFYVMIKGGN